jgi:uncharacterized protein (TIGR03067 family)
MLTLICVALLGAGAPPAALQGDWFLGDYVYNGGGPGATRAISSGATPDMTIKADRLILYGLPAGRVTVDDGKDPKTIDMAYEAGESAGKTEQGIYKLKDDTLTICTANFGDSRPRDFSNPKGAKRRLYVYQRQPIKP